MSRRDAIDPGLILPKPREAAQVGATEFGAACGITRLEVRPKPFRELPRFGTRCASSFVDIAASAPGAVRG